MYISKETPEQTGKRLITVIAQAEFKVFDGTYAFEEFPLHDFPFTVKSSTLALVRDDEVWSQLVPSTDTTKELFKIFRFHFKEGLDNSGFVGWLASHLKHKLGTGVFVICGQNSSRGGIFDYWGCPLSMAESVIKEIRALINQGNRTNT